METPIERKSFIFKFLFYINLLFSLTTIGINVIGLLLTYDLIDPSFELEWIILGKIIWFFLGLYQMIFMISLFFYKTFFTVKIRHIYVAYWIFSLLIIMISLSLLHDLAQIFELGWYVLFLVTLIPMTLCIIINGKLAQTVIEKPALKDS